MPLDDFRLPERRKPPPAPLPLPRRDHTGKILYGIFVVVVTLATLADNHWVFEPIVIIVFLFFTIPWLATAVALGYSRE